MSSMPKDTCTECRQTKRSSEVTTYDMCNKHRLCKECVLKQPSVRTRATAVQCPVCELSRRRLAVTVRADLAREERSKVQCKVCDRYGPGTLMSCGHGYCPTCVRTLPKSALSRNLDGTIKRGCPDCEKKAAQEFREEARSAMQHAESCAMLERDAREHRERMEDIALLRATKPRKRQAPKAPEARPLTVPKGPDFACTAPKPKPSMKAAPASAAPHLAAKPSGKKAHASGATVDRKVSFNPMVEHKIITPLQRNKRLSLPAAAGAGSSSATARRLRSDHHSDLSDCEPMSPVEKLRTFSRHWGVNSP